MVQRQNRVVAGRVSVLAFALMGLYSCAALSALGMGRTPDACPTLRDAQAWINKMPSINQRRDHAIMVSLMFEDETRAFVLEPMEAGEGGASQVLALELRAGGDAVPGSASFRAAGDAARHNSVAVYCAGEEMARIDNVKAVY